MNQNFQIAVLVFYSLYYFDHLKCHKDTKFQWKIHLPYGQTVRWISLLSDKERESSQKRMKIARRLCNVEQTPETKK